MCAAICAGNSRSIRDANFLKNLLEDSVGNGAFDASFVDLKAGTQADATVAAILIHARNLLGNGAVVHTRGKRTSIKAKLTGNICQLRHIGLPQFRLTLKDHIM